MAQNKDATTERSNQPSDRNKCMLKPYGTFFMIWNSFLFIILMYSVIETPFIIAFVKETGFGDAVFIMAFIVDLILMFDIAINFRTGYIDQFDRLRIISDPKKVRKHYLKTWFTPDLLSSFPFTFFIVISADNDSHTEWLQVFRLVRFVKLLRVIRIFRMFDVFQVYTQYSFNSQTIRRYLRAFKVMGFMLLTAHYCACLWYLVGSWGYENGEQSWVEEVIVPHESNNRFEDIPPFTKYTYSIYWAIVTLFTTGYGDIAAHNKYEMWTAIVCIIIGSMFFAYLIGVLTTLLSEDKTHVIESQKIEESLMFCRHYKLPKELTIAILTHIRYYCNYNYMFDYQDMINILSPPLQKQIYLHLATNILSGLNMFQSLPADIIGKIALKLKSKSINMGQQLFKVGDIGKEFFIQRTGISELYYYGSSHNKLELNRGDVCGENIIINRNRLHTVKCQTWSEYYVLNVSDIVDVLQTNLDPKTAKKKWHEIKESVRRTIDLNKSDPNLVRHVPLRNIIHEEYIPNKCLDKRSSTDIFEKNLIKEEEENEEIAEIEAKRKRNMSIAGMKNLFNVLQKQGSTERDKKVRQCTFDQSIHANSLIVNIPHISSNNVSQYVYSKVESKQDITDDSDGDSAGFAVQFDLTAISEPSISKSEYDNKSHKKQIELTTKHIKPKILPNDTANGLHTDFISMDDDQKDIDNEQMRLLANKSKSDNILDIGEEDAENNKNSIHRDNDGQSNFIINGNNLQHFKSVSNTGLK